MMISMNAKNNKKVRPGVALLVVLFIVMAITILSLGFVSRSDVELACGQNMILRTEMDYLAESGLEHARGLILNPQDVSTEFWTGGTGLQLASGGNFYDVTVNRDANDFCNYIINCNSYRRAPDGSDIGRSSLEAELRLDPCIAYWAGSDTTVWPQMTINGDVYCDGILTNSGTINGDAFATDTINGTITGRKNESVSSAYPVAWPGLVSTDFGPMPYYIGLTTYSADEPAGADVASNSPSWPNLAGIYYCAGNANMPGNVTINGTLVVGGDLTVSGLNNVITAVKDFHFPALLVGGKVLMKDGSSLVINGLAQIELSIAVDPSPTISPRIDVIGGLFIHNGGVMSPSITVNVTADPAIASIEIWPAENTAIRWSPVAGAFYRSIERIK